MSCIHCAGKTKIISHIFGQELKNSVLGHPWASGILTWGPQEPLFLSGNHFLSFLVGEFPNINQSVNYK